MRCPRCFRKLAAAMACPADGAQPTGDDGERDDDAAPTPAPTVDGWTLGAAIARGGQAVVWRARRGAQEAAIKVAHAGGAEVVAGFAREAAAMRAIGAPAVPALVEHGALADGRPFVAMELVHGATLGDVLARAPGALPTDEVVAWLDGIARALDAIHHAGYVHGDLKPDNIVRDDGGAVRLLDLGMARAGDDATPGAGGTALYMAPEQLRAGALSPATDLYGLGAVGFELATTRPPFVGDRAAIELGHLSFRAPRARTVRAVPAGLDELLAACLAKAPAQRPVSARAVIDALAAIDRDALVTAAAPAAVANRSSVALVAIERAPASHNLDALARGRGGLVARQAQGRTLLAFTPDDCPAPIAAAVATAQAVAALGARAIVHVAQLVVRRGKDGRAMLFGPALDRPAEWLPASTAAGVLLTDAAARELDGAELEAIDDAHRLRDARPEADLAAPTAASGRFLGGERALASALASAAGALDLGPPASWVALGDAGTGKSRLLDEVVTRVTAAHPDAAVVRLAGARSFAAGGAAALHALRTQLGAPAPTGALPLTAELRAAIDAVLAERPLVIAIDDAQWIDDALLAALGAATRSASGPLWLAATATEALAIARPAWLDGARVSLEHLAPLDDADARALVRRALAPARRVPEALIARLAARTGGNPGVITALARELRRAGVVRRHPGSDVWFVAADELDFLPPAPGVQWFAARRLAGLGPGLAELARAIARCGAEFDRADVEAVTAAPEAGVRIDPDIGLAQLVAAELVQPTADGWRFASEAEQDAIADTVAAPAATAIHAAALAAARARTDGPTAWTRMAFHAARADDHATAIAAAERLAADAAARHAPLEAERWLTLALDELTAGGADDAALRQRLLGQRGATRRLLTHYETAQADLRAARELAVARGDEVAVIELQIADGAVCDFTERLGESARLIEDAAARAPTTLPPAVQAQLDNWLGVVRARQERLVEARALLTRAIAVAEPAGDHATAIGSRLMLGGVLRRLGLLDDGRAVLDRAIELCDRQGDHFHLAIGLFNRVNVWRQLDRAREAEADAERAIGVANRMGLDQVELWGWYDLSLLRFWAGELAGALAASEASHRIGSERFREAPPVVASVWYALLLAAAGEVTPAQRELEHLRVDDLGANPFLALTRDLAALACAGEVGAAWAGVIEQAGRDTADPEDAVFVWWMQARTARRVGDAAAAARCHAEAVTAAAALGRPCPPLAWPGEEP